MFIRLLAGMSRRFGVAVHAYCLIPNHIHLLLRPEESNLSRAMHWLESIYAREWNKRHGRGGHVFQGRFHLKPLISETALLWVSRYIHRNPLEPGLVEKAADWPWSSMPVYAGSQGEDFLTTSQILRLMAREKYVDFVEQPADPVPMCEWYEPEAEPSSRTEDGRREASLLEDAGKMLHAEASAAGIPMAALNSRRRPRSVSAFRQRIALRLSHEIGASHKLIASLLGISISRVSQLLSN